MPLQPDDDIIESASPAALRRTFEAYSLTVRQRLLVMLINYVPPLHAAAVLFVLCWPWAAPGWRVAAALAFLYLVPAVIARVIVKGFPLRYGAIRLGTPDFFKWWLALNLQMLFCRLPFLEEALRVIPLAYSAWLRLWGSKVGRMIFWAPGTVVLDRSFLEIGDDVLFGAGVQLIPHLMVGDGNGGFDVLLAPVRVGERAVVGGLSLLGPGSEIAPGEATTARLMLHPFTKWENGRRVKS